MAQHEDRFYGERARHHDDREGARRFGGGMAGRDWENRSDDDDDDHREDDDSRRRFGSDKRGQRQGSDMDYGVGRDTDFGRRMGGSDRDRDEHGSADRSYTSRNRQSQGGYATGPYPGGYGQSWAGSNQALGRSGREGGRDQQRTSGYAAGSASYSNRNYGADYVDHGYARNERGFFERAGDEVASWFGDEEAAQRREADHRGRGPQDYTRSDDRIREDANDRLTEDWKVDASGISVTVSQGEVTLNGTVPSRDAKRHAEDCVEDISGVKHVQNNLRVQQTATGAGMTGAGMSGTGMTGTGASGTATSGASSGTASTSRNGPSTTGRGATTS